MRKLHDLSNLELRTSFAKEKLRMCIDGIEGVFKKHKYEKLWEYNFPFVL